MDAPVTIDLLARHPRLVPLLASWVFTQWGAQYRMASVDEQLNKFSERLHVDRFPLSVVAFVDSAPVGTASLKLREMTTHPKFEHWVGAVYVLPSYRYRGIGSTLMQAAEGKARELGVDTLYLHTADRERYYLRRGWETIEQPVYLGMTVAVMKKELRGAEKEGDRGWVEKY